MAGKFKLEIVESEEDLQKILQKQKIAIHRDRVRMLYLIKSQKAETLQEAAKMLGRHRVTIQTWARKYRDGGLLSLVEKPESQKPKGRPRKMPQWLEKALEKRLKNPEGFTSYQEIVDWLESKFGVKISYKMVHRIVHYYLKSSPKVPRPMSRKQNEEKLEEFKKKRRKPSNAMLVCGVSLELDGDNQILLWR